MTVERMIKELKKMDPKATVKMHNRFGEPILFVLALANDENNVWVESESDMDLSNELEERFRNAVENQLDELDFYADLLEIGITVEHVCRYMGEEAAKHMEKFCEEHGLV